MLGQGVYIFLLKHILKFMVLGKNFTCTWLNIWWGKSVNKKCISFLNNLHEGFCSNKQKLGAPRPFYNIKVLLLLQILHATNKGFTLQGFVCCGASKWKLLICQSIRGLCKASQYNPMMIGFFGDEMTLLVWKLMVTSNALVSCVIGFNERIQLSMTLTNTNVSFSTKANLYCHINSLSMKHVNAP